MKTGSILLVLLAASTAAVAAWFAARAGGADPSEDKAARGPSLSVTGRSLAAHLDYSADERLAVAKFNLARMASDPPERIGALKEEVALLCDDDRVAAFVAAEFPAAAAEGAYYAAAFGDVFASARRPEFVEPVRALLRSDDVLLRRKGAEGAVVQRDPSLLPDVLIAMERGAAEAPEKTLPTRIDAVRAASRTGGQGAAAILQAAMRDPDEGVRRMALEAAAELKLTSLDANLRDVYSSAASPWERAAAAAALADRDPTARATLLAALDPRDQGTAAEAASAVLKFRPPGAAEAARAHLGAATGQARVALRTILAAYGDPEELARATADVSSSDLGVAAEAAAVLSRCKRDEVADPLLEALRRHGAALGPVVGAGFAEAGAPGRLLRVAERLVEIEARHPAEMSQFGAGVGAALVPKVSAELDLAKTDERRRYLVSTLMNIGGVEARAVLFKRRFEAPATYEPALRIVDLELRRTG